MAAGDILDIYENGTIVVETEGGGVCITFGRDDAPDYACGGVDVPTPGVPIFWIERKTSAGPVCEEVPKDTFFAFRRAMRAHHDMMSAVRDIARGS